MTTTIKITALSEIGSNLATSTVVPVVNMAGTPTTQKTTVGNIANLALTQAGNAYPAAALATLAQTVTNAAQPNITSVGTLTGLTSTGDVTFTSAGNVNLGPVGNVKITGGSSGQILSTDGAGNLSWVNDSTTYGNSNVAAYLPTYTGNLTAANIVVTGNITPSANVTYNLGNNTNRWNNLYLAGNTIVLGDAVLTANANALIVQTPDGGNFVLEGNSNTTFGNIVGVNLDGNSSNLLFGNGSFATPPSAAEVDVLNTNGLTTVFYPTFVENRANGQIIRADVDLQYRSDTNTLTVGNIAANNLGNIASINLNGNGQTWLAGNGTFANINVPTVGNIATINLDGNAGNILYGNGAFAASPSVSLSGDGGNLSNINGANVNGIVANANITDYINVGRVNNNFSFHVLLSAGDGDKDIHVDDSDNLQYNPNSGLLTAVRVDAQNFVGNLYYSSGYAVANVDGIGNIATINLSGNGSQVLAGNGAWVAQSGGGNASLPLANGNSNIDIATANGPVTLTSAGQTWTIGTDGTLTAPNGSNIYPAGNNFNVFTPPAGSVQFYSDNGNYSWSLDGFGVMNLPFASAMSNTALVYSPGNLRLDVGANNFMFTDTGTVVFPTLNVDLHNGGNQYAQTLQFGDDTQQAIITGPTPAANVNAQRLIIQGQRGNGTGEGGDVYFWAGDADTNGGDIKIYAGDADNVSAGYGGYINLEGGRGYDGGGQISVNGGYSANGPGGTVNISAGQGGSDGGAVNINGGVTSTNQGGNITLTGGYGGNNGGEVRLTGGSAGIGLPGYGNIVLISSASTWTFDNTGTLTVPQNINGNGALQLQGLANGNTTINIGSGVGGDIDMVSNLGNINLYTANNQPWIFDQGGNLTAPGAINVGNMVIGTVPGDITADADTGVTFNVSGPNGGFAVNYLDEVGNANTSGGELAFSSETGNATYRISLSDDLGNGFATKIWRFDGTGNLVLAGGNSVIYSIANSSLDPTNPNVSTMTLTPDANYNSQVLVLDPTAPGHIHLRAYAFSNIDEPAANIFLGGEDTAFEITSGANNEARIHSNNYTWIFGNDGALSFPRDAVGNTDPYLVITGGPAPAISSVDVSLAGPANLQLVSDYLNLTGYTGAKVVVRADDGEIMADANMVLTTNAANVGNEFSWTFATDGSLTLAGNLISSGASPAPSISGFSSISTLVSLNTPVAYSSLTAIAGLRAFINDANLVAAGNFGQQVSGGGANSTPVWSDGTNWYIG